MKYNIYSFSFLNTYNFPIFKIWRRKTVWPVLIFDGFSIFRVFFSLFFTGECLFPRLADLGDLVLTLALSKLNFTLFAGELSGASWIQHVVLTLASVQTETSPSDFSNACRSFLARSFCRPIIRLSSSHTSPNHATWLTLTYFVQQTKVHRVQIAYPFLPYHFNGRSLLSDLS